MLTGRTEYVEKYFETIGDILERGFAVAILDWRGQGGSGKVDAQLDPTQFARLALRELPRCFVVGRRGIDKHVGTSEHIKFHRPHFRK